MCITVAEADAMVESAHAAGLTLAGYHNRRHDGNVRAIREIIESGELGEVFHLEVCTMGHGGGATWGRPGDPWRTSKAVSGGGLYDWGAHAVDWVLSLVPSRMTQVTGFLHRLSDHPEANEDQTRALIRFENGCVAEIMQSRAAYFGRPYLWLILGTRGAIMDSGHGAIAGYCQELDGPSGGSLTVRTAEGEREVPYLPSDWATYYRELAARLRGEGPVPVSGEDGRRVIAVLQTAGKSALSGHSEPVPYP
jgi:predicted dehydrogenase